MAIIDKPSDYFNTKLYTGTGSTLNITGVGFQPDLVWTKGRDSTAEGVMDHALVDSVRGVTKTLRSNTTGVEGTEANSLTTFGSDGYTVGANGKFNYSSSDIYVSWNWKAGTSFTNDASATGIGSIDSSGSVNQDAGFSICSYTGAGGVITVKHGLNTVPSVIITKNLSDANHWGVYHHKNTTAPQTDFLYLSDIRATTDDATMWNDTAPTSSIFTAGDHSSSNRSGDPFIAYFFSEKQGYSKFGSYTGNGNADGTFVYTGFKPAFVMVKKTSGAGSSNWVIADTARSDVPNANVNDQVLYPNLNNSEESSSGLSVDLVSNGFKIRGTGGDRNTSGAPYIYMAFAENPFVTSTGVPATAR
jgi:hypothetical protein